MCAGAGAWFPIPALTDPATGLTIRAAERFGDGTVTFASQRETMSGLQTDTGDPSATPLYEAETELRYLRQTVHALRQELEKQQAEKTEGVQRAIANAQGEITQLRKTAAALRDA